MILKNINIDCFGALEDISIDLYKGINVIKGNNESGKSTVTAFLSSIFYDFDKYRRAGITEEEKWRPWKKNVFSGSVEYKLDTGDTFKVYRDFTEKNPQIFNDKGDNITKRYIYKRKSVDFFETQTGIDKNTFLNTSFLPQNMTILDDKDKFEMIQKIINLSSTGDENVSMTQITKVLNDKLRDEVGNNATKNKPYNNILAKLNVLRKEKAEISNINNKKEQTQFVREREQKKFSEVDEKKKLINTIKERKKELYAEEIVISELKERMIQKEKQLEERKFQTEKIDYIKESDALNENVLDSDNSYHDNVYENNIGIESSEKLENKITDQYKVKEYNNNTERTTAEGLNKLKYDTNINMDIVYEINEENKKRFNKNKNSELSSEQRLEYEEESLSKRNFWKSNKYLIINNILFIIIFIILAIGSFASDGMKKFFGPNITEYKIINVIQSIYFKVFLIIIFVSYLISHVICFKKRYDLKKEKEKEKRLIEKNKENLIKLEIKSKENEINEEQKILKDKINKLNEKYELYKKLIFNEYSPRIDSKYIRVVLEMEDEQLNKEAVELDKIYEAALYRLSKLDAEKTVLEASQNRYYEIEEELSYYENQFKEIEEYRETLNYVKQTLEDSFKELKGMISPEFMNKFNYLVRRITSDKYTKVFIQNDKEIYLETGNDIVNLESLSAGTVEQINLSFRLATLEIITTENMPIILDETFAYYDDNRLANILRFFSNEYKDKQIIILSCNDREKRILNQIGAQYKYIEI